MKKIILFLFAFTLSTQIFAQQKEGKVIYEEIIKFNFKIDGMDEEFLKMMPKENKSKKVLYFNEEECSYQESKEIEEKEVMRSSAGGVFVTGHAVNVSMSSGGGSNSKVYINYKDKKKIEQKDFMTRTFLIKDDLPEGDWKMSGKQKMVLKYPCQAATKITDKDTITAWFTPVIQIPAGPNGYVNLPGLVLEVDINHGKIKYVAKEVNLEKIDKKLISKPKKGKKVTAEQYAKIVEEKMKEMGVEEGKRGGTFKVITVQGRGIK